MHETRRDKLSKGWSYPLKASVLERVILDSGIQTPVTLFLHHGSFWAERPLFSASFYLAGSLVTNTDEAFWVSCRSVAAADVARAREFVEGEALPAFAKWAAQLEALPLNSTFRKTDRIVKDLPSL